MSKYIQQVKALIKISNRIEFLIEIDFVGTTECYLMIQWGSGKFEYSINNEIIFTGQLEFIHRDDVKLDKSNRKTFDHFYGCISKDEVYAIFENNGFYLGDNFKNITNVDIYKNNILGYVQWKNDWIYFLDGLLKFPLLENIDIRFNEAVTYIRQLTVNPKTFEKNTEGGTHIMIIIKYRI